MLQAIRRLMAFRTKQYWAAAFVKVVEVAHCQSPWHSERNGMAGHGWIFHHKAKELVDSSQVRFREVGVVPKPHAAWLSQSEMHREGASLIWRSTKEWTSEIDAENGRSLHRPPWLDCDRAFVATKYELANVVQVRMPRVFNTFIPRLGMLSNLRMQAITGSCRIRPVPRDRRRRSIEPVRPLLALHTVNLSRRFTNRLPRRSMAAILWSVPIEIRLHS